MQKTATGADEARGHTASERGVSARRSAQRGGVAVRRRERKPRLSRWAAPCKRLQEGRQKDERQHHGKCQRRIERLEQHGERDIHVGRRFIVIGDRAQGTFQVHRRAMVVIGHGR